MPEILAVSPSPLTFVELEQLAPSLGLRLKIVVEVESALKLLGLRTFGALVIDAIIDAGVGGKLSQAFYEHNSQGLVCAYVRDVRTHPLARVAELGLLEIGLDVISGVKELRQFLTATLPLQTPVTPWVLIVEDLDTPREIMQMYLENLGYRVEGVASARLAYELLEAAPQKYQCIITDIRMPEMTGIELIGKLRSETRFESLPIIVLSAYGTGDTVLDCLQAGASGILAKPPRRDDLMRELGKARRIAAGLQPARLVESRDMELVREMLRQKGFLDL